MEHKLYISVEECYKENKENEILCGAWRTRGDIGTITKFFTEVINEIRNAWDDEDIYYDIMGDYEHIAHILDYEYKKDLWIINYKYRRDENELKVYVEVRNILD